jgi:hypothetical protein
MHSAEMKSLPYRIHTNYELGLMLAGTKPIATWTRIPGVEDPRCLVRYWRMFDRHVALGRFNKFVTRAPLAASAPWPYGETVYYVLPGEEWRVASLEALNGEPTREWTLDQESKFGSLLGYTDGQMEIWLGRLRDKRTN